MNPKDFYNKTADIYEMRHSSPATRQVRKKERFLIRKFQKGRTLDFGCGTGFHLNKDIIGVDISENMLKKARGMRIHANESLPIQSTVVHTIFCFLTVLNMVDIELIAKEFHRILKPEGRLLLSVASIFDHEGRKEKTVQVQHAKMRLRLFTRAELENIFSPFHLEYFDSLFILTNPLWGNFTPFSFLDKGKFLLEKFLPKEKGKMYFMVFKK